MFDFLCVQGTKKNFEKGTIVLQALVQDCGAIICIIIRSNVISKGIVLYASLFSLGIWR